MRTEKAIDECICGSRRLKAVKDDITVRRKGVGLVTARNQERIACLDCGEEYFTEIQAVKTARALDEESHKRLYRAIPVKI